MMTDREKRLSLALDALTMLEEDLQEWADWHPHYRLMARYIREAKANIEAAAMPKPSVLRRLFTRREAA
jgi:hypothetical protein